MANGSWIGPVAALIACAVGYAILRQAKVTQQASVRDLPVRFEGKRQPVKYALDAGAAELSRQPHDITLAAIAQQPDAHPKTNSREYEAKRIAPFETTIWRLHARVVAVRKNEDGDILLELQDGDARGIAEIPEPILSQGSVFGKQIRGAWSKLNQMIPDGTSEVVLNREATLVGLGFIEDEQRESRTHAANGAELHPVIDLSWH